jgi:serine/threonine protein kinase
METYCGTPANMAPEIVRQEKYSVKADVFSYSIILWELVTREDPYPEISGLALAYAVANDGLRPCIPQYCPAEFADLIERCWAPNQDDRPDFGEILDFLQLLDVQVKKKTTAPDVDGKSTNGFGSLPRFLKEHEEKLKSTLPKFVPGKQPLVPRVSRGSGGIKADVRSILLNESFIKGTGDDEHLLGGDEEAHRTYASSVDSVVVRDVNASFKETSATAIPPHSRQSPSLDEISPPRENRKLSFDV